MHVHQICSISPGPPPNFFSPCEMDDMDTSTAGRLWPDWKNTARGAAGEIGSISRHLYHLRDHLFPDNYGQSARSQSRGLLQSGSKEKRRSTVVQQYKSH